MATDAVRSATGIAGADAGIGTVPTWYSKSSFQLTLVGTARAVLAPVIAVLALAACTQLLNVNFNEPYVALSIIAALLCLTFIRKEQFQHSSPFMSGLTLAGRIGVAWLAVVGTLLFIGYATKTSDIFSRRALFLWFTITPPLLVAGYMVLRYWHRMALLSSSNARTAVIAGVNSMSLELARIIRDRPELSLKLLCMFDEGDKLGAAADCGCHLHAGLNEVPKFVNSRHVDVVFIALPVQSPEARELLDRLRDTTSSVYLIPDLSIFDLIQARSDDIQGVPVIALCESPFQGLSGVAKRATDLVLGTLMVVLALPVLLGIAVAIKLTSPGPVIFRQRRYGLDGEQIIVYKFRTMSVTEDGNRIVQARRGDPRVTPVGRILRRTSLDELPQLLNVLQGRMSLVGPRPHAVAHNEQYRKLISGYMVRHKVVPGITGLAQINGCRGETATLEDMRQRVMYDIEYMRQWCWLLDVKILLKTCTLLIRDKHAY